MGIKHSRKLQEAYDALTSDEQDNVGGVDNQCTNGYDNDGSTGLEIFENGVRLGQEAEGKDIWTFNDGHPGTSFFLIGTEEEVLKKLAELAK